MAAKTHRGWFKGGYKGYVQTANTLRHPLLLLLRLYWGALLVIAGLGKWINILEVANFFSSLEIPAPLLMAYIVGTIEFLGGISLFFGIFSRFFSLLVAIVMITAYGSAHKEAFLNFFSDPKGFTTESPFLYLLTALIVLCFGPGLFSFDYWFEKKTYGHPL
jgi:putative oxidoreductase